ncbi:MAG TPA: CoA transferase, partial [Caulobacteraceae bacterium]|nr:CoA transferase [Caulobacteraceae bacterium]
MAGSLEGLRVLDCTHLIAGAYCSMMLADFGADVVKIEPIGGESTRGRPENPFKPFDFMNRNKRAIAIDMASPEGAELVRTLAATADVFVENYRPGSLDRMGLGYDALAAVNPGLIYASVSGFGLTGPYRERAGLDLVVQAMSGLMSVTGPRGAQEPVAVGVPISDLSAGLFATIGVLAALEHRRKTGEGQRLETSLLEAALAYLPWEAGQALTTGAVAAPNGTRHRLAAPYEALRTGDGWMVVGVTSQKLWLKLCEALGTPELAGEADFAHGAQRLENRDALQARLESILASETTAHWVERIAAGGVPCGPINDIAQALADPQIVARGML